MRRLAANVAVRNPETGMVEVFTPGGAAVPDWAADLIRNPKAWAEDEDDELLAAPASVTPPAPPADDPEKVPVEPVIPPKGGPGSGKEAWAAYAQAKGVEVDADASRDDIIAALAGADVPTE